LAGVIALAGVPRFFVFLDTADREGTINLQLQPGVAKKNFNVGSKKYCYFV
jgi:hypothetical protein